MTDSTDTQATLAEPELANPGFFARVKSMVESVVTNPITPVIFGAVLVSVVMSVLAVRLIPGAATAHVVSFDAVKFLNAQRSAASILASGTSSPELALAMSQVARQVRSVIAEEAGGATVVIRQAIVLNEQVPDITDRVLTRFGLPTDVPTVTTQSALSEDELIAPSDASLSGQMQLERYKEQLKEQENRIKAEAKNNTTHAGVLP